MVSVFLVNDGELQIPNPSSIAVEINGISSTAERGSTGDLTTLNKVNSIPKVTATWDLLSIEDMETLCSTFGIDVAEYLTAYQVKTIEQLVYKITTRLPCGVSSFSAYVGDTIAGSLVDYSGDESGIGGQYWENVSISLIGLGESWQQ